MRLQVMAEHGENDPEGNIRPQAERAERLESQLFMIMQDVDRCRPLPL